MVEKATESGLVDKIGDCDRVFRPPRQEFLLGDKLFEALWARQPAPVNFRHCPRADAAQEYVSFFPAVRFVSLVCLR